MPSISCAGYWHRSSSWGTSSPTRAKTKVPITTFRLLQNIKRGGVGADRLAAEDRKESANECADVLPDQDRERSPNKILQRAGGAITDKLTR